MPHLSYAAGDGGFLGEELGPQLRAGWVARGHSFGQFSEPSLLGQGCEAAYGPSSQASKPLTPRLFSGYSSGARQLVLAADRIEARALLFFGYPFHGPRQSVDRARVLELAQIQVPVLICQGERDPHGNRAQVTGYSLPKHVTLHWMPGLRHRLDDGPKGNPALASAIRHGIQFLESFD